MAYSTNSASICTVASNGTITAKGAGSCVVTATFSKTGFANETKNAAAITIIDGTMGTITWNNAYASGELVIPDTRTLSSTPTIDSPSTTSIAYSTNDSTICTVAANGTITAKATGSCTVTVTFSADGYTSKTENAPAIAIVQAMGTITWDNPYTTGDLTVPATRTIANVPTIDSPSGTTGLYKQLRYRASVAKVRMAGVS